MCVRWSLDILPSNLGTNMEGVVGRIFDRTPSRRSLPTSFSRPLLLLDSSSSSLILFTLPLPSTPLYGPNYYGRKRIS